MKWYYQVTHHPIWDYDMSSPPLLADIMVDGKPVKAVAVPTKQAFLYMFDRITGKPIWPIVEKPVPQSDVPGEKTSKTQPFPTKPAGLFAARKSTDGRSDRLHAGTAGQGAGHHQAILQDGTDVHARRAQQWRAASPRLIGHRQAVGGTNWPGGGFNPETHVAFLPASMPACR